ncbi:acyl-CoA dehydrogenase family protein [Thermodesulfobacteriota bacterium]
MDFALTEEQRKLREEVREFLADAKAKGIYPFGTNTFLDLPSQEFSKAMSERGLLGLAWPKEYGGQGMGYMGRLIMLEEMFLAGAPIAHHYMGDRQVGPGIIHFGSDALKEEFLPKILNGEARFCLLFSEPDAGSDLASCRTEAVDAGDHYIVNGQKVWTTGAHQSDYGWALVKTNPDPSISRYNVFSEMIIDLNSPGVTIRPIINMVGFHSFNEVFFDNVKVPKKYLVGKKDNGFRQIMANLDFERSTIDRLLQNCHLKDSLIEYVKTTERNGQPLSKDSLIRDTVAKLEVEFQVARLFIYFVTDLLDRGKLPTFEAAMGKTVATLYEARLADVATNLMGLCGLVMPDSTETLFDGAACQSYLWSPSYTLQGGSVEVLKNIIAIRGLKLAAK